MGIEESYKELCEHVKKLENFGMEKNKIQSMKHSIEELYALSKQSQKFQIGDKVKIVKKINFENAWGWKPFKEYLSVGCVGTVKRYGFNTYYNHAYIDLEINIPRYNKIKKETTYEPTIFMMNINKLEKID